MMKSKTSYIRIPSFSHWYPNNNRDCQKQIESFCEKPLSFTTKIPLGGIVPHAGWYFSGPLACQVFRALQKKCTPDVVVILGAVHRVHLSCPSILRKGEWQTPIGNVSIDETFTSSLLQKFPKMETSPKIHETEHSIELEVPFLKYFFPSASLVPIMVSPISSCLELGEALGKVAQEDGRSILFLASTDLSHYGHSFGYEPYGTLPSALEKVHQIDMQMIQHILELDGARVLLEAEKYRNACGAGAVATAIQACKITGASTGELLEYTTSMEIRPKEGADSTVGYGAILLG